MVYDIFKTIMIQILSTSTFAWLYVVYDAFIVYEKVYSTLKSKNFGKCPL